MATLMVALSRYNAQVDRVGVVELRSYLILYLFNGAIKHLILALWVLMWVMFFENEII